MSICAETDITRSGTIIGTPNFPLEYEDNLDCEVTIRFGNDKRVLAKFSYFELEDGDDTDWLDIIDGNVVIRKYGKVMESIMKVESTGPEMTLQFHTDDSGQFSGFVVQVIEIGKKLRPSKIMIFSRLLSFKLKIHEMNLFCKNIFRFGTC